MGPCRHCEGPIWWMECPTGGWWIHDRHPLDDHDAEPLPCPECNDEGWVTGSEHDPGCFGGGPYCEAHCPVQVQLDCPSCSRLELDREDSDDVAF